MTSKPLGSPVGPVPDETVDIRDMGAEYHSGPAKAIHKVSPDEVVEAIKVLEARRIETINELLEARKQVAIDSDRRMKEITGQLHALGWKAARQATARQAKGKAAKS